MWLAFLVLVGLAIGAVLLVLGIVAAVIGVLVALAHVLPLLLIAAGAWLLVRAARGPRRGRWHDAPARPRRSTAPRASTPPADHRSERRTRPAARPRRELPIDVQILAEQVRRKAEVLLGHADRFPAYSQDLHIVRQTAAEYLPRTIGAYLALPGIDDPVVGAGGRTALQELREQLELMDAKLDEITRRLQRDDLDRMLANRRFLEDRFDVRDDSQPATPAGRETGAA